MTSLTAVVAWHALCGGGAGKKTRIWWLPPSSGQVEVGEGLSHWRSIFTAISKVGGGDGGETWSREFSLSQLCFIGKYLSGLISCNERLINFKYILVTIHILVFLWVCSWANMPGKKPHQAVSLWKCRCPDVAEAGSHAQSVGRAVFGTCDLCAALTAFTWSGAHLACIWMHPDVKPSSWVTSSGSHPPLEGNFLPLPQLPCIHISGLELWSLPFWGLSQLSAFSPFTWIAPSLGDKV
jgi:hypothetical protein